MILMAYGRPYSYGETIRLVDMLRLLDLVGFTCLDAKIWNFKLTNFDLFRQEIENQH